MVAYRGRSTWPLAATRTSTVQYVVVFDVATAGYKSWPFPAFGLIFVATGFVLVALRNHLPGRWRSRPRASAVFSYFFLGFAILWTVSSFITTYRDYSSLEMASRTGHVSVVEGRVSHFTPMPVMGHSMEHFCIESNCFEYSDYAVTAGFNNTTSHGGPIRDGLPVRVSFNGNRIAKLEVAQ